jgi:hypothetical protein
MKKYWFKILIRDFMGNVHGPFETFMKAEDRNRALTLIKLKHRPSLVTVISED